MNRNVLILVVIVAIILVVLLIAVNVTRCDTISGPFGFLRITACSEEPLLDVSG